MNIKEIEKTNLSEFSGAELGCRLLRNLPKRPYLDSMILVDGMMKTAYRIHHNQTHSDLTPSQRAIFVWAYLEAIRGIIKYALQSHEEGECILVKK